MNTILLSAAAAAACGAVVGLSAYAVPAITAPKAPLARSIAPGEGGLTDLARGRDGLPGNRAAYGRPRCDGSAADDIHDDDRDETSAARRAAGCGAKADGRDGPSLAGGIGGAGGLAGLGPDGGSGGRGGAGVNGGIGGRGGRGGASF